MEPRRNAARTGLAGSANSEEDLHEEDQVGQEADEEEDNLDVLSSQPK